MLPQAQYPRSAGGRVSRVENILRMKNLVMSRQRLSLDGPWEFFPDPRRELRRATLGATKPRIILVPGPWQAQFDDLRDYSGVAWYRRTFEAGGLGLEASESETQASSLKPQVSIIHFGA